MTSLSEQLNAAGKKLSASDHYEWDPGYLALSMPQVHARKWKMRYIKIPFVSKCIFVWMPWWRMAFFMFFVLIFIAMFAISYDPSSGIIEDVIDLLRRAFVLAISGFIGVLCVIFFMTKAFVLSKGRHGTCEARILLLTVGGHLRDIGKWVDGKQVAFGVAIDSDSPCVFRIIWDGMYPKKDLVLGVFLDAERAIVWSEKLRRKGMISDIVFDKSRNVIDVCTVFDD